MNPGRVALFGALGGALNATLCWARFPEPVDIIDKNGGFGRGVIPAGAVHGAVLAFLPWICAWSVRKSALWLRVAMAPVVAWVAAYWAWIPLHRSVLKASWGHALVWPFGEHLFSPFERQTILLRVGATPFFYFGTVGLLYYWSLAVGRPARRAPGLHILFGVLAGVLGSAWWWLGWGPGYFCMIHGAVWGLLVGYATWKSARAFEG